MEPKYKRILLKLSGEALAGDKKTGLDYEVITSLGRSIKKCVDAGVEVGIVVGGYSSVCLAGAMWYLFRTKIGSKKKKA